MATDKRRRTSPQKEPFAPQRRRKKRKLSRYINVRWALIIVAWTFVISTALSFVSGRVLDGVEMGVSVFVLFLFIFLNILFDIIGIAIATVSEKPFHSMSSRRVRGAQESLWLIRRADKVSNFCSDVVGDICGIISGTTSALVAVGISADTAVSLIVAQLIVSGVVASVTVGGKAVGKSFGMGYNTKIIHFVGRLIRFFHIVRMGK